MIGTRKNFDFAKLNRKTKSAKHFIIPSASSFIVFLILQLSIEGLTSNQVCKSKFLSEWTLFVSFGEMVVFSIGALSYFIKLADSTPSYRYIYFLCLAIFSLSLVSAIFRNFNRSLYCDNYWGIAMPISFWTQWFALTPSILQLIFAVREETLYRRPHIQLTFSFALTLVCAWITQFSSSSWTSFFFLFLGVISFCYFLIICYRFERPKLTTSISPISRSSDIQHFDDLEWACIIKNITFLLYGVVPLYAIVFLLTLVRVLNTDYSYVGFVICNILSNVVYVNFVADNCTSLTNSLITVATASAVSNSSRSQFLRYVFHEIRNPLNSLSLGLLSLANIPLEENADEAVLIMKDSVNYMSDILNDVISMHKIEEGVMNLVMQSFEIKNSIAMVKRSVKLHAQNSRVTIKFRYSNIIPNFVVGDRHRFQHSFINILTYLINVSPENSTLLISCNSESSKNFTTNQEIARLTFTILADELSISSENLALLFEPFGKLRSNDTQMDYGTGLGLALARDIIELQGGRLEFVSNDGHDFILKFVIPFEIPARKPKKEEERSIASSTTKIRHTQHNDSCQFTSALVPIDESCSPRMESYDPPPGVNCLVVDDALSNRKMLGMALKGNNFICDLADNGRAACEAVKTNPDKYSIIFMDNTMPIMSGMEATQEMRKLGFNKLIMGLTGNVMDDDVIAFLDSGVDIVLSKPLRLPEIEAILTFTDKYGFDSCGPRSKLTLYGDQIQRYSLDNEERNLVNQSIAMNTLSDLNSISSRKISNEKIGISSKESSENDSQNSVCSRDGCLMDV